MREGSKGEKDSFERVGGQELEEAIRKEREVGEESSKPKVRTTEAVPSEREVEEHNVGHGVFRSWCPHCVKGRAESYGKGVAHVRNNPQTLRVNTPPPSQTDFFAGGFLWGVCGGGGVFAEL